METETNVEEDIEESFEQTNESDSVFQNASANKEPPLGGKKMKQKTE